MRVYLVPLLLFANELRS